jgi:hypothetical protein
MRASLIDLLREHAPFIQIVDVGALWTGGDEPRAFDFSLRLLELHDRKTGTAWCDAYRNS